MRQLFFDAINPYTGRIHTLDDANLFFGADGLGYARDSWDEGFVPYVIPAHPSSPTNPPPSTRMTRQNYFPTRQADQAVWLENFRLKLVLHAVALGLAAPRVADIVADARWLVHLLVSWLGSVRSHGKAATSTLEQAMTGDGPLTLPVHTPPPLADGVVARPAGALSRIFDFIAEIKENDACTEAIQIELGILGSVEPPPDMPNVRPDITAILSAAGVQIGWGWQGLAKHLDQCEIQVDRADGKGWVVLTYDTTPGYLDTTPFPAALTKWKYRAIYRVDDHQVGLWSAEVSVNVGG
ncbi:MAG: hypothetical protein HS117_26730 [Verrucomicrobiaceae bacterium]|nr:hypothetical protein [Verrucomicrobiaceae bacterium]